MLHKFSPDSLAEDEPLVENGVSPDKVDELLRMRGGELSLVVDLAVHVQHVHREGVGLQPEIFMSSLSTYISKSDEIKYMFLFYIQSIPKKE